MDTEMATEFVNLPEINNYLNEIKLNALNYKHSFCDADYDPEFPEYFFTKWVFSMGILMAEKTKAQIEGIKKCQNCPTLRRDFETLNSKHSTLTKSYNHLLSFVRTLDPLRTQNFLDSQPIMVLPNSPKGVGKSTGRTPLTPVKANNNSNLQNNVHSNIPDKIFSSPYHSPKLKKENNENVFLESQSYTKNTVEVGSPLHCSTQSSAVGKLDLQYDERMKIKNSVTPKKKKKEMSPLKITSLNPNNVQMTPQVVAHHKLGMNFNESNDSIEIFPETPPDYTVNGKEMKINIPELVDNFLDGAENAKHSPSPIIVRSKKYIEAIQLSRSPFQNRKDEQDESPGSSPSIISKALPRNLMDGNFGSMEINNSGVSRVSSHSLPNNVNKSAAVSDLSSSKLRKSHNGWVKPSKKSDSISGSGLANYKFPNKGVRYKQTTLLQMKKPAIKSEAVDISTLDEFDGGTRPMMYSGNTLKRKSDENATESTDKGCPSNIGNRQVNLEDETFFEDGFSNVPKPPKPASKGYKREKKEQLNTTANFIVQLDKVPNRQSQEPAFAYKPERPIRKKEERAKLTGYACDDCRDYYNCVGDEGEEFVQNLKDQCSKHRGKFVAQEKGTPPGFWDVNMASTMELKRTKQFRTESFADSDDDFND